MTIASACSTGLDAIQWGSDQIQNDQAEIVFAGSTEAPISEFCFATLCALGALSTFDDPPLKASRPYDRRRDGLVLGEGAAICVLEELEHAKDRGAHIYAEVLGHGTGNEGGFGNKMNAAELALTEAIKSALTKAAVSASDLDYINAHGNSLPDYDLIETRAFHLAFGNAAYCIPTSSIKSMIGHAMGAASAFQTVASCLTLEHSIIPPTINYEVPDPECDLDYVPNVARTSRVRTVLINAHAMGGTHSVLVLRKPEL
jgi:3-oxoacyl-(acyl-carrier-protein) synthase